MIGSHHATNVEMKRMLVMKEEITTGVQIVNMISMMKAIVLQILVQTVMNLMICRVMSPIEQARSCRTFPSTSKRRARENVQTRSAIQMWLFNHCAYNSNSE